MGELRTIESLQDVRFAGDWDFDQERECYRIAYPAVRYGAPEHGAETPVVEVYVLRVIVRRWRDVVRAALAQGDDDMDRLKWVGDRVRVQRPGERARWLVPDGEGHYDLQPLWWEWSLVDPESEIGLGTTVLYRARAVGSL
jgi:hypothetical protein